MNISTEPSRNMSLKAFDPHRASFECKHEADHVPPIDPEAEAWLQEGLRLTSFDLWPNQRDYPKAIALWAKAAERKHWKAMMNLAGVLIEGDGTESYVVPPDPERAIKIVEEAMRLGIPAAFDAMGTYHQRGLGVQGDSSRAYAFWELAADMGSPSAQTYLGKSLDAVFDSPKEGFWANKRIGLAMLECAFGQAYGPAAIELGVTLNGAGGDDKDNYARALVVLHEGVKFGNEDSASYLSSKFRGGGPLAGGTRDIGRADRYSALADALYFNPDLKFPNLDKVLPLPPAPLPKWDGNKQTLIDAAKAVVPLPPAPADPTASAASQRTGRAHIPEGWTLPDKPQAVVPAQWETVSAPESGYWIARLIRPATDRQHAWDTSQVPLRYDRGELFDRTRPGLRDEDGRLQFHYLGRPVEQPPQRTLVEDPRVARGIARYGEIPEPARCCRGHATCPRTGIWAASVVADHASARVFNHWDRQSYVLEGQRFPDTQIRALDIYAHDVVWHWLGQPNEVRAGGIVHIDRVSAEEAAAPRDKPATSVKAPAGNAPQIGEATSSRRPLGRLATTGDICPETGWWQSQETALPVQGGRRHFFRAGESMAGIVLLGKGSVWQQLRGTAPTHPANTVWELVDDETSGQQASTTKPDDDDKRRDGVD